MPPSPVFDKYSLWHQSYPLAVIFGFLGVGSGRFGGEYGVYAAV